MRSLVIALMIALLPLRGWVGEAMAQPTLPPVVQALEHASVAHHDCALHQAGSDMAQDSGVDQDDRCTLCQVCHTLALEAFISSPTTLSSSLLLTRVAASDFASAERALSVEPPIA